MSQTGFIGLTLRRRVTVLMLAAATVVVGLITYAMVPVELVPRGFSESEVTIWIPVAASNPLEVQEQIVRPAEEQIRTIPGISERPSRCGCIPIFRTCHSFRSNSANSRLIRENTIPRDSVL